MRLKISKPLASGRPTSRMTSAGAALQRFLAGRAPGRLEAVGAQRVLQRVGDAGLVLDDEDRGFHSEGRKPSIDR
jgi:hypothetical protein